MKQNASFRHESLQDRETIQNLLEALTEGIGKGKITLEDADGTLVLQPSGLLRLKITGTADDDRNRLDIRLTWHDKSKPAKTKPPKIKAGKG